MNDDEKLLQFIRTKADDELAAANEYDKKKRNERRLFEKRELNPDYWRRKKVSPSEDLRREMAADKKEAREIEESLRAGLCGPLTGSMAPTSGEVRQLQREERRQRIGTRFESAMAVRESRGKPGERVNGVYNGPVTAHEMRVEVIRRRRMRSLPRDGRCPGCTRYVKSSKAWCIEQCLTLCRGCMAGHRAIVRGERLHPPRELLAVLCGWSSSYAFKVMQRGDAASGPAQDRARRAIAAWRNRLVTLGMDNRADPR